MNSLIVMAALACLIALPPAANAAPPPSAECKPAAQSVNSIIALNYMSQPVASAIVTETGDASWEREQAIYQRTLEFSKLARRYEGEFNAEGYDLESRLIDAKYSVALAEIDQLAARNLQQATARIKEAKRDVRSALVEAQARQRKPIESLANNLHRVKLTVTECHGQSRGENRYQYEKLLSSFNRVIHTL